MPDDYIKIGAVVLMPNVSSKLAKKELIHPPSNATIDELRECQLYIDHTDKNSDEFLRIRDDWSPQDIDTWMRSGKFGTALSYMDDTFGLGNKHLVLLEKETSKRLRARKNGSPNFTGKDLDVAKGGDGKKFHRRILYFGM